MTWWPFGKRARPLQDAEDEDAEFARRIRELV